MKARILIVDDNPTVTITSSKILQRAGYAVITENDSLKALTYFENEIFDLLLTDVRMPKMDGMTLLSKARKRDPHLGVIVITGFGTMDDAVKAIRLGAQGFILKPFEPNELLTVVEENLQRRTLLRDGVRLQTLLPLMKVSDAIQEGEGASTITEQALQVVSKEIGEVRLQTWFVADEETLTLLTDVNYLTNNQMEPFSHEQLQQVANSGLALWCDKENISHQTPIKAQQAQAICLPLMVKESCVGLLTASLPSQTQPLGNFNLELLQVLSRQLAIAIDNINLFKRVETLRVFNQNIIENITTGLIALNKNGIITVFNKAALILLGLIAEDVLNHPVEIGLAHIPQLSPLLQLALIQQQPLTYRDIEIEHWDGGHISIALTTSPIYNTDNQLIGIVALLEDLTEVKTLEAERRRLDRLADLGQMSAVVAHELRNPIAGIAAGVDYLSRKIAPDSALTQACQMVQEEVNRIHRIVEDILLVARPMNLQKTPKNLLEIFQAVQQKYQKTYLETTIELTLNSPPKLPTLLIDRTRIEQVINNLMENAIQAMPDGGLIDINITLNTTNETIAILFKDTGHGIPYPDSHKVFEPFFTTKNRGTGLGLALSRRILEAHGGNIKLISSTQHGTLFELTLPIVS